MAIARADLVVRSMDSGTRVQVTDGQTTPIGIIAELRGQSPTITASSCRASHGSLYVDLTTSHATAGQVTATITDANLTTLGASATQLSCLTAFWSATVTDGSGSQPLEYQMPMVVTDRTFRHALLYSDLVNEFPILGRSSTYPLGQTSHWTQVKLYLDKFNRELNMRGGAVRTWLMTNPEELTPLVTAYVLHKLALQLLGHDNGQSNGLQANVREWKEETARLWAAVDASIRTAGTDWQTEAPTRQQAVNQITPVVNRGTIGWGGPW